MQRLSNSELYKLLEQKTAQYNNPAFIESDPISIPHRFTKKEDIEIAGFFAATIAWGNRKSILVNAGRLMDLMHNEPAEFIRNHRKRDRTRFSNFVHRTFNGNDCMYFLEALQHIYLNHGGLEPAFQSHISVSLFDRIVHFRNLFFELDHPARTEKHVSNPAKGSSAKRLCMFLRWMVRDDHQGVDFGLWRSVSPSLLCLPLDVHTGNVGRQLGLLKRKQNDWQAVEEITNKLRKFDASDPVKYDFALFGMGVHKDLPQKLV